MFDHLRHVIEKWFQSVSAVSTANMQDPNISRNPHHMQYAAQRFNACAEHISRFRLKMGVFRVSARCMCIRFILVSLISWPSLSAAVRQHSADWNETQAAKGVTEAMFP